MNDEILKELKTLNTLLALVVIELNKQDGKPHVGHSILPEKIGPAIALVKEVSSQIIVD